jgi:hypothetical protein
MAATSRGDLQLIQRSVLRGAAAVLRALDELLAKGIEPERVARATLLLVKAGVLPSQATLLSVSECCLGAQQADGGWTSVPESAWCAGWLRAVGGHEAPLEAALAWIRSQRNAAGGWGRTARDTARLPVTGVLLWCHPELADPVALDWLLKAWGEEAAGRPVLSYKAAAVCLALSSISSTHPHRSPGQARPSACGALAQEVNPDGGWGPWRSHPEGSTPLWTAMALAGLASSPGASLAVLPPAAEWLVARQMPEGLWPAHFLEEAAAWAVFALSQHLLACAAGPCRDEAGREHALGPDKPDRCGA